MRAFLFIVFILRVLFLDAQSFDCQFLVIDDKSGEEIEAAHVFLANSTFGSFTDAHGKCQLTIPEDSNNEIIISHLSYQGVSIAPAVYKNQSGVLKIELSKNEIDLQEISVSAKRDKRWKKRFNRFTAAFIGEDNIAAKCKILNPEVLRFEESDGKLNVSAIDLIKIKNDHLKYELLFLLNAFTIDENESSSYRGRAFFIDLAVENSKKTIKARDEVFKQSQRYYLKSVIDNTSEQLGFRTSIQKYSGQEFIELGKINPSQYLKYDSLKQVYQFLFSEFLQVVDTNIKSSQTRRRVKVSSGRERERFANMDSGNDSNVSYATSQLYMNSQHLLLDNYGHILNPNNVQDYGYWADQHVAYLLPWDYGIEWKTERSTLEDFKLFIYGSPEDKKRSLETLKNNWKDEYKAPLIELVKMSSDAKLVEEINSLLRKKAGYRSRGFFELVQKLWTEDVSYSSFYPEFKGELYKHIDERFEKYFQSRAGQSNIRFDEILWGGVEQDGIPPLRYPEMLSVQEADYLDDDNIVFGVKINGVTAAYPKRILAWHEFFVDDFDGVKIAGVYCTLCGTVIAYDMTQDGVTHDLGTSGFLYQSNKLMYDQATQSLWSTVEGKPVVGPLINQGIELESYPVVTTTWKEWKEKHPDTKVLSLDTGFNRNYDEGEAYKNYYSSDRLMFPVPRMKEILKNKDEVFVVRIPESKNDPVAYSIKYLKKNRVFHDRIGDTEIVILTDENGAARAYESLDLIFDHDRHLIFTDQNRVSWYQTETGLESDGRVLKRLSGHNIFWFAWYSNYPNTRIIK